MLAAFVAMLMSKFAFCSMLAICLEASAIVWDTFAALILAASSMMCADCCSAVSILCLDCSEAVWSLFTLQLTAC